MGSQPKNEYGIGLTVIEAQWLVRVIEAYTKQPVDRRDSILLRLRALIKRFG